MAELATNQGKNGQLNMKWTAFLLLLLAIGGDALAAPAQVRLLQAPAWRSRCQVDDVSCPVQVHSKDLFAFLVEKGKRCRTVPDFIRGRFKLRQFRSVQPETRSGDVTFDDFQSIQLFGESFGTPGDLAQSVGDTILCARGF